jgi:uncharacterized protein (TIGR03083 family)
MRIEEYLAALSREGELMAEALAQADLDQTVPTCPDWTLRELGHHIGRVHRWAATHVRERRTEQLPEQEEDRAWGEMPADDQLVPWFRTGHAALLDALATAPEDLACWTFLPADTPLVFWARRQAHETAVHRADAQGVAGAMSQVPAGFAVDGIDELLLCFYGRPRNRVRSETLRTLAVAATDADAAWLIRIGPEGARPERSDAGGADGEVRGPASDLYLALWNRAPIDRLELSGDTELVGLWQTRSGVRWS